MTPDIKISSAFEPFLSESGPNDKLEAIVIYKAPVPEAPRERGRMRRLRQRQDYIKVRAAAQKSVQANLLDEYKKEADKSLPAREEVSVSATGRAAALPIASVEVTRKTLPALAERQDVVAVLPNQKIHLLRPKAVDYSSLSRQEINNKLTWGLELLDVPQLWKTTKGKGINVAVLDTGVYGEHPALEGRVTSFAVIDPLGRPIKAETFDADQHGTHVCGTIAGGKSAEKVSIGVAPQANLLVAAVLLGGATLRSVIESISWAIEQGADIINMSLGFTYYEPLFSEVFKTVLQYGALPVVAVGNENYGNSSCPGNAYNAFSVGAVEKMPGGKVDVTFFSSGASLVFPGQVPPLVTKPDVVAPGSQVYSCIPPEQQRDGIYQYTYMDGTSMATPHVAGVAALLMAAEPSTPVDDIMKVLRETAKHEGGPQRRPDNRWGYGLVQPVEALKALKT